MINFLSNLLPAAEQFGFWIYWLILAVMLVEGLAFVGLIIPGTLVIILAGFLSAKGFLHLGTLILFAGIGAIGGNFISYYLGKSGKNFFHPGNRIFKSSYLQKGELFFEQHGGKSLFLGQFIGPMRPVIPFVAGLARFSPQKFIYWNIASSAVWLIVFGLLGFFFGQAWRAIELWTTRAGIFVFSLILFVIAFYILKWLVLKKGPLIFALIKSIFLSIKKAVIGNADVQQLVRKHPLFFGFISRRLARRHFTGLPLTFLTVAFVYVLFLFFGIIEDFVTASTVVSVDLRVANLLAAFRHPQLTKIFFGITLLGNWEIVASLAITITLLGWFWRKRNYLFPLWLAIIGSELFGYLGKLVFHRPRPAAAVYFESSYSFPSGHAMVAMVFYGFITYFLWRQFKSWTAKINALFGGLIIILAIGFSRLYLGVHFFSDVWAGYLLGALWLIIAISLAEWLEARKKVNQPLALKSAATKKLKIISLVLILAEVVFCFVFFKNYQPPLLSASDYAQTIVTDNVLNYFQNNQWPKFTETLTGQPQEPLGFIVVAQDNRQLINIFQQAGWYLADEPSFQSMVSLVKDALFNKSYSAAPMTPSFWHSQVHNFGFEKPTSLDSVRQRHHARFWQTPFKTQSGQNIYIGTASLDIGLKWGITHKINPDIDTEKDFLMADLQKIGAVANWRQEQFVEPALGINASGDQFFTNGKIYSVELK